MITKNKILEYAEMQGYDYAEKCDITWNGYDVWKPKFDGEGVAIIGYPLVILVKGNEIRMSSKDESLEILDIIDPPNNEED